MAGTAYQKYLAVDLARFALKGGAEMMINKLVSSIFLSHYYRNDALKIRDRLTDMKLHVSPIFVCEFLFQDYYLTKQFICRTDLFNCKNYGINSLPQMFLNSGLLTKTALDPAQIDYLYYGTVIQESRTSNIAREVS